MFELIDTRPDVNVQESEYIRLLGYPRGHALDGRPKELAQWAREWYQYHGKAWVYARQVDHLEIGDNYLMFDGSRFSSKQLREQFADAGAESAFVAVVSAGEECETAAHRLWQQEKPDEYFFLEMYGSAVVEHLIAGTGFRFCEWADGKRSAILPHYSPGYPGWDISDQRILMDVLLSQRTNVFPSRMEVLESGMLNPKKSLLAVFGITSHLDRVERLTNLVPCENCPMHSCRYRRVPYRKAPPLVENVLEMQRKHSGGQGFADGLSSGVQPGAAYRISTNVLRKWSHERLRLKTGHDGSVEATFRYEGTTCSNLGHPLEFDYHIKLGSPERGYLIEDVKCCPSPADEGYQFMCEYIAKGDAFLGSIAGEKPLLGKRLEEVITWDRPFAPAGCFCDSKGREHKWGLVFEVLHYALAHKEDGAQVELKHATR